MLPFFQPLRILDRLSAVILRVYQPRDTVPSTADGIIGIGIGLRADGGPSPMSAAVAKKCVDLYNAGVADRIVFTGGYQRNGTTEAEAMSSVARRLGVPESALIIENKSRRTHLNAFLTKPIVAVARFDPRRPERSCPPGAGHFSPALRIRVHFLLCCRQEQVRTATSA